MILFANESSQPGPCWGCESVLASAYSERIPQWTRSIPGVTTNANGIGLGPLPAATQCNPWVSSVPEAGMQGLPLTGLTQERLDS